MGPMRLRLVPPLLLAHRSPVIELVSPDDGGDQLVANDVLLGEVDELDSRHVLEDLADFD